MSRLASDGQRLLLDTHKKTNWKNVPVTTMASTQCVEDEKCRITERNQLIITLPHSDVPEDSINGKHDLNIGSVGEEEENQIYIQKIIEESDHIENPIAGY